MRLVERQVGCLTQSPPSIIRTVRSVMRGIRRPGLDFGRAIVSMLRSQRA